jgi:hypothetical protein
VELKPMRREKNGSPFSSSGRANGESMLRCPMRPNSKMSASCRKKSRCSGKNKPNRVRLTWRSSTSVAEKSVFSVSDAFNDGVSL